MSSIGLHNKLSVRFSDDGREVVPKKHPGKSYRASYAAIYTIQNKLDVKSIVAVRIDGLITAVTQIEARLLKIEPLMAFKIN